MKKLYVIILVLVAAFATQAQVVIPQLETQIYNERSVADVNIPFSKVTLDTMGWNDFVTYSATVYSSGWSVGGYVFGTSGDVGSGTYFNTFAQGYINDFSANVGIVGALIWVSDVDIQSASGCDIQIKAAKVNGTSSYTDGTNTYNIDCPGAALATTSFNINDVDTVWASAAGIIGVDFPTTVLIAPGEDLAIIFDASNCTTLGDTIGVIASDDGVIDMIYGDDYTWLYYPGLSNYVLYEHIVTGGNDNMPAVFAIVDLDYVNVEDVDFFQNMQLTLAPNPTADILSIAYAVNQNMNAQVDIIDMNGRIVYTADFGFITSGAYGYTVDVSGFAAGQYYVSFATDAGRLTKKLIVQ